MNGRNARDVSLEVLTRVERKTSYSNLELHQVLCRSQLSPVDRNLVTELVYGTIQRRNTLDWILAPFVPRKLELWVRQLLRMSVYQLKYLDKVPARAAVHEAVEIAKRRGHRGVASVVNAVLRNVLRHPDRLGTISETDPVKKLSLEYSHPEWLVKRWLDIWDVHTVRAMCDTNNRAPSHTVRVNRLKLSREELATRLEAENPWVKVRESDISAYGLIVEKFGNVADSVLYREGTCTVQDESSMLVGEILKPAPGSTVLDMCAAPGGKATHLAELMDDEGTVDAFDLYRHKVKLIDEQAKRLGVRSVRARQADARQLPRLLSKKYDYVLLDAPCSGLGVIRRKPEIKWRRSLEDVGGLVALQQQLLDAAAQLVQPGGVFVYSTCTLEPKENEQQVEWFLRRYPAFQPDESFIRTLPVDVREKAWLGSGMVRILPQYFRSDGFFIARFIHMA